MKKIAIAIGAFYVTLYFLFPKLVEVTDVIIEDAVSITKEEAVEYLELIGNVEDEMERFWGEVEGVPYMIFKDVDSYIYIDGAFYEVDGYWENGSYYIEKKELNEILEGSHPQSVRSYSTCENLTQEEVIERLSKVNIPLTDAFITTFEGQLPGASRDYRNGYHEGFDWYSGTSGVLVDSNTDVFPMYAGKVVRIDTSYTEMTEEYRNGILEEAAQHYTTPQKTLDLLRGRQVWVQSSNGVLVRYAHLSAVNEELKVGDYVTTNISLGKVGNSGTSNGAANTMDDYHLHSDILVCGKLFWEYGEIQEMNNSIIEAFNEVASKD